MRYRVIVRIVLMFSIPALQVAPLRAALANGDFEQNPPKVQGWNVDAGAKATPPDSIVIVVNGNSAEIGPSANPVLIPGAQVKKNGSSIEQINFTPAGPQGSNMTLIRFDAQFAVANNKQSQAVVIVTPTGNRKQWKAGNIPATNGFQSFRLLVPGCAAQDISFGVAEDGNALQSTFRVDHVTDGCVAADPGGGTALAANDPPPGGCVGDPNCDWIEGILGPNPASIPTLSQWGLIALVSSIAIAGGITLFRRAALP
ncbi:MAG: IPTL-CTERM sorting domain-containing protein [Acidobacteria bacterium]|nr:IPTL-CTERM sorting domain-containing protein [Acidobacteriota bacterium]